MMKFSLTGSLLIVLAAAVGYAQFTKTDKAGTNQDSIAMQQKAILDGADPVAAFEPAGAGFKLGEGCNAYQINQEERSDCTPKNSLQARVRSDNFSLYTK